MAFKNILVATDFSQESAAALDAAIELGREPGATIQLLHVVDDPVTAAAWSEAYAFDVTELSEQLLAQAERRLTSIQAAHTGIALSTRAVVGHPARTILEMAAAEHADLIVVGSHGHHAITRLLLGSVADRVVRQAPCAVLIVKAVPVPAESTPTREAKTPIPA